MLFTKLGIYCSALVALAAAAEYAPRFEQPAFTSSHYQQGRKRTPLGDIGPPSAECGCTKIHLHSGEPIGKLTKFSGVNAYITPKKPRPKAPVILYLTDIFGYALPNPQLLADKLSAKGSYTVIVPDLFNGDPIPYPLPPDFNITAWLANHTPEIVTPLTEQIVSTIRSELAPTKLGAVGYCFGAKYVARLAEKQIDAGYIAHPSFVELAELERSNAPLAIAAAETDEQLTPETRHLWEDRLKALKKRYTVRLYSGVSHGFAVRGDENDKWQVWAMNSAQRLANEWFDVIFELF